MNGLNGNNDGKEEKKGGFWPAIANLFGRGPAASGGAMGGFGSAGSGLGGFGWLFATKAGIMGTILGAATIAAGIGVVYNFLGPSSKSVYTPQLFQDNYYEDQSRNASMERAKMKEGAASASSGLDMFRDQAKKDGLGLGAGAAAEKKDASPAEPAAGGQPENAGASADAAAEAPAGGAAKLQLAAGFGGGKLSGGLDSSGPKLSGGGGMFGGINGQFSPVYRPPAGAAKGKSSAMKGALASSLIRSPKQTLTNFNKKKAFGQAKFAKSMGLRAAGSASAADSRTSAAEAFSGETAGTGDVGLPAGGVGLGGAGIASGMNLKNSDPSISSNDSTAPTPATPENKSPWKWLTYLAMIAMIMAAIFIAMANKSAQKAKELHAQAASATGPQAAELEAQAQAEQQKAQMFGYMAIGAAGVVIFVGVMMMFQQDQKWAGIGYMIAGGMLIYKAIEAIQGAGSGGDASSAVQNAVTTQQAGSAAPGQKGGDGTVENNTDFS